MEVSVILISAIALVAQSTYTSACSCYWGHFHHNFCLADLVPRNDLAKLSSPQWTTFTPYTSPFFFRYARIPVDVLHVFKAEKPRRAEDIREMYTYPPVMCGMYLTPDHSYLIFANKDGDKFEVSACSGTARWSDVRLHQKYALYKDLYEPDCDCWTCMNEECPGLRVENKCPFNPVMDTSDCLDEFAICSSKPGENSTDKRCSWQGGCQMKSCLIEEGFSESFTSAIYDVSRSTTSYYISDFHPFAPRMNRLFRKATVKPHQHRKS